MPVSPTQVYVAKRTHPLLRTTEYQSVQSQSLSARISVALNNLAIKLHSFQGIDETASALGMSLSGNGQPLESAAVAIGASAESLEEGVALIGAASKAASAVAGPVISSVACVLAVPIVGLGAYGAAKECYALWKKNYPDALHQILSSQEELIRLFESEGKRAEELSSLRSAHNAMKTSSANLFKIRAYGKDFFQLAVKLANASSDANWYAVARCQQEENHRHITRIERDIVGPANAVAMVGMTSGLPIAGAGAVAATLGQTAIAHTAEQVAMGIFLPAQAAMITAGSANVAIGLHHHRTLAEGKRALAYLKESGADYYTDQTPLKKSIAQLIDRQRAYNQCKMAAGALTAAGQSMMAAGTITSLTPAAVASPALFALGAASTISASAIEITSSTKKNTFIGHGHSEGAGKLADQNAAAIRAVIQEQGITPAVDSAAAQHTYYQSAIARIKFYSLLMKVLHDEEKSNAATVCTVGELQQQRKAHLQQLLNTGNKNFFIRTSLLKADLELMREEYRSGRYLDSLDDLQGSVATLRSRLVQSMQRDQDGQAIQLIKQLGIKEAVARKVIQETIYKLNKQKRQDNDIHALLSPEIGRKQKEITVQTIEDFACHNEIVLKTYDSQLAKHLIKQGKTDAKFLRHATAQHLILLAHTAQLIEENRLASRLQWPLRHDFTLLAPHNNGAMSMPTYRSAPYTIMDARSLRDAQVRLANSRGDNYIDNVEHNIAYRDERYFNYGATTHNADETAVRGHWQSVRSFYYLPTATNLVSDRPYNDAQEFD